MQKERDRRAGLNTAGYVTGYRGSPLGGARPAVPARASASLDKHDIVFQAGINEDLAATALWGTQQAELRGEGKYDGVFGIWYGKGPGVDRTGDVFRHANFAGTSKHGGVLALMGDDHTAESSTTAHQSEFHFVDVMIPILNPAGVQEILDYGLYGWAMSRFAGVWVGAQMHARRRSSRPPSIDGSLDRVKIVIPTDFAMPEGGLNIRLGDTILGQEARLHDYKRDAMLAFVRANKLNRIITSGGRNPKIGIITTGKSYLDVRQALDELGIDEVQAQRSRLRLYKVGCPWPLEPAGPAGVRRGPRPHHRGRGEALADRGAGARGALRHRQPAGRASARRTSTATGCSRPRARSIPTTSRSASASGCSSVGAERASCAARVARLKEAQRVLAETADVAARIPYFCSGCPHNSSTVVPEGIARLCRHRLPLHGAVDGPLDARASPRWAARAPTGSARRRSPSARTSSRTSATAPTTTPATWRSARAIASGVNITYKILFNDAVAMTGGQTQRRRPHGAADRRARSRPRAPSKSSSSPTSRRNIRPSIETGRRASPSITATTCNAVQKELAEDPGRARC